MSGKLYKYIGPDVLSISFSREGYVGFKCSLPKDYNDPFELSLCIDKNLSPQLLAFYLESVGEIPQWPTSCFSKSPIVIPMWAHYSQKATGFVIEIDEEKLGNFFENASINDVLYSDSAHEDITSHLQRAFSTCKPRHTFFFHKAIMYYAYYSKQTCWSYEQERRLVVPFDYIEDLNGNMIFYIPVECVSSIIAGERTASIDLSLAEDISNKVGCCFFQSFIGLSYSKKYMKDLNGMVHVFDGDSIVFSKSNCVLCSEPVTELANGGIDEKCSWCAISEYHKQNAADSNPYRVLDHAGILESHIKTMEEIYKGNRTK